MYRSAALYLCRTQEVFISNNYKAPTHSDMYKWKHLQLTFLQVKTISNFEWFSLIALFQKNLHHLIVNHSNSVEASKIFFEVESSKLLAFFILLKKCSKVTASAYW